MATDGPSIKFIDQLKEQFPKIRRDESDFTRLLSIPSNDEEEK